jgi:site-specific recombinase XerD
MRSIQELTIVFDQALVKAGYSESRLTNFRTVIKRLLLFGAEQGIEYYSSSIGKQFLEKYYPVEFDGHPVHELPYTVQYAWRTIALLNDFNTHGSFIRARRLKGNLQLTPEFQDLSDKFGDDCRSKGTSEATVYRRQADLRKFFNYLHSNKIAISEISHKTVVEFLDTIITLSDDTVEHHRRTVSLFLQFLFHDGYVSEDYSRNMPTKRSLRKNPLPSVWEREDVDRLLSAVDRGNPIGKRDYAILLLVTKLGLRVGDIRALRLGDIDWENSKLSFVQSKTQKRVDLPLPNDVGWAIIDYLKYGRPKTDIQNVFLTGRTPIMAFSDTSSLSGIIIRYAQMAKIDLSKHKHGMHSLRHTLATRLMEENIPISTIANILGHSSTDTVKKYLQVDISHLRDCALDVEALL